jgi:hypothetical protein
MLLALDRYGRGMGFSGNVARVFQAAPSVVVRPPIAHGARIGAFATSRIVARKR